MILFGGAAVGIGVYAMHTQADGNGIVLAAFAVVSTLAGVVATQFGEACGWFTRSSKGSEDKTAQHVPTLTEPI